MYLRDIILHCYIHDLAKLYALLVRHLTISMEQSHPWETNTSFFYSQQITHILFNQKIKLR